MCRFTDESDPNNRVRAVVQTYIIDNVGATDLDALCEQVVQELRAGQQDMAVDGVERSPAADFAGLTADEVKIHVTEHMLNQNVVMTNTLRDLIKISKGARDCCIYINEDTGNQTVEPRMVQTYIKTIETIANLFRTVSVNRPRPAGS